MIRNLTRESLADVRNPRLRAYARQYVEIYEDYLRENSQAGLPIEQADRSAEINALRAELRASGATFRNADHSILLGELSPACEACRTGMGSVTLFTSLKCHRHCFYCFNPNQEGYDHFSVAQRDLVAELRDAAATGVKVDFVGLTGGEPLLFPDEALAFFRAAKELYPAVHTRLYTSGDHLTEALLGELRTAGLDEIRISVRVEDGPAGRMHTYSRLAMAREFIPTVMVETPVLPGTFAVMAEMLRELDRIGIFGVNLLEFCFPLHNAQAFQERGYQVKNPPHDTLYDYWYAGGLPIAGSEQEALRLLQFAISEGLSLGVHYCSLSNKHTAQVFQQNDGATIPRTAAYSERDFFIRSAKVFGRDAIRARKRFESIGFHGSRNDLTHDYLEFHPSRIPDLKGLEVEVALCSFVQEERPEGLVLRELKVGLTTPDLFDPATDL